MRATASKRIPNRYKLAVAVLLSAAFGGRAMAAECGFSGGHWQAGEKIFQETCVACHGEDGRGAVPGTPDFTKKDGVLKKPHSVLAQHIKQGFQPPGAQLAMPPKGGNPSLSEQDMKDVHAYLHHKFGCG